MGQSSESNQENVRNFYHGYKVVSLLKLNNFSDLFIEEAYRSGRFFLAFYFSKAHFSSL